MDERIRPTKSGLFAIELLIAVGIFSLCAAICMGLFVRAEVMSQDAADLNRAVSAARGAAECFKAAGGNLERTAALTGGETRNEDTLFIEFDENWQPLPAGEAGAFALSIARSGEAPGYAGALLEVKRYDRSGSETTGESLLTWDIAALEVSP